MSTLRHLKLTTRRLVVLVIVATLASMITGWWSTTQPVQYTADATVFVNRVLPTASNNVDSSIADFETVMRLPQITALVSRQTGASRASIASGVSFRRVGSSSAVSVSYTGSSA